MSHEMFNVAGAETVINVEGDMCGAAMRGAVALPGSKATSRTKGSRRNLGGLTLDRRRHAGPHAKARRAEAHDARA